MKITDLKIVHYACTKEEDLNMSFTKPAEEKPIKVVRTLLKVETDEGITGIAPAESNFGTHRKMIEGLKDKVIGENPFNIEKMAKSYLRSYPGLWALNTACEAFAGFEIACWDIIGKNLGVPLYMLMGGLCEKNVPITAMLGVEEPQIVAEKALKAVEQGIKTIKVKVGCDPVQDIETVRTVRQVIGDSVGLRVDANQAWTVPTAVRQIGKMTEFDIEYIEQPIPVWDYDGLSHIRQHCPVPVCICEGLYTIHNAVNLIRKNAVDYFSTDPFRMGGITQLKKLCGLAEAAGVGVVAHWSEDLLATAVFLHWLVSTPITTLASDLTLSNGIGPTVQLDNILTEPILHREGKVDPPRLSGIGVEINYDKLDSKIEEYEKLRMDRHLYDTGPQTLPSLPRY